MRSTLALRKPFFSPADSVGPAHIEQSGPARVIPIRPRRIQFLEHPFLPISARIESGEGRTTIYCQSEWDVLVRFPGGRAFSLIAVPRCEIPEELPPASSIQVLSRMGDGK